jgi:hypothetical protein
MDRATAQFTHDSKTWPSFAKENIELDLMIIKHFPMLSYLIYLYKNRVVKIREQEGGTGPVWEVGTSGRGEGCGETSKEGEHGANNVYTWM